MSKRITVGIDVGTYQIKIVVAEIDSDNSRQFPAIIGTGYAESKGLRHGYIINSRDIARSINVALRKAERQSGEKIKRAYLSVGGVGLEEVRSKGEAITTRADSVVTDMDIAKAIENAEERSAGRMTNKKMVHSIPLGFKIDSQSILGSPRA